MILRYGDYQHDINEAAIRIERENSFNPDTDQFVSSVERWFIAGVMHGDTQTEITQNLRSLEEAYSRQYEDLVLLHDDGSTETNHKLHSVKILRGPSFPKGDGTEYAPGGGRTYEIEAEGRVELDARGARVKSYRETLSFEGGLPLYVFLQPPAGKPIKQMVAQQTPFVVRQSGSALSDIGFPPWEPPLWPDDLVSYRTNQNSPKKIGAPGSYRYSDYESTWDYEFIAVNPFVRSPHFPP